MLNKKAFNKHTASQHTGSCFITLRVQVMTYERGTEQKPIKAMTFRIIASNLSITESHSTTHLHYSHRHTLTHSLTLMILMINVPLPTHSTPTYTHTRCTACTWYANWTTLDTEKNSFQKLRFWHFYIIRLIFSIFQNCLIHFKGVICKKMPDDICKFIFNWLFL